MGLNFPSLNFSPFSFFQYVYKSNDARYSAPMTVLFGGKVLDQISEFNGMYAIIESQATHDRCDAFLMIKQEVMNSRLIITYLYIHVYMHVHICEYVKETNDNVTKIAQLY